MCESEAERPTLTYAIQYFDETGAMRAPYLICKGFLAAGWDVRIITTASPRNAAIDFVWDHVPVQRVEGLNKKVKLLRLAAKLLRRRERHVILTTVWDWHCFSLALSRLLFGSPYIMRLDTYTHRNAESFLGRLWEEIRYGFVMRNASIILAETPKCFDHATRYLKRPKVLLVPSCFWYKDLKEVEARWEREGYQPKREPIMFYAGRFIERKNVHDLINAFVRLSERFPEWKLEMRGPVTSCAYYASLQDLARSSRLDNRIRFLPSLSGEQLYRRYRETSIYALPSEGEGLPTTIAEAMYFGGAIVAGESGHVGYQLGDGACGLLHKPGDIDSLTAHLETLMASEQERNRYMSKARERIIKFFIWEEYFPMLEEKVRALVQT
jgi:glycosyltransferase involved in cell wall biosynthesis